MKRDHVGGIVGRGVIEKESLRRDPGGGIMDEQSVRRNLEETSGGHLGAVWEASGMDSGIIWKSFKNQLG